MVKSRKRGGFVVVAFGLVLLVFAQLFARTPQISGIPMTVDEKTNLNNTNSTDIASDIIPKLEIDSAGVNGKASSSSNSINAAVSDAPMTSAIVRKTPQNHSNYTANAGFIHLGKTGGSTLSVQLVNGCHSYVKKPCHHVENETAVSKLVSNYYHSTFSAIAFRV